MNSCRTKSDRIRQDPTGFDRIWQDQNTIGQIETRSAEFKEDQIWIHQFSSKLVSWVFEVTSQDILCHQLNQNMVQEISGINLWYKFYVTEMFYFLWRIYKQNEKGQKNIDFRRCGFEPQILDSFFYCGISQNNLASYFGLMKESVFLTCNILYARVTSM